MEKVSLLNKKISMNVNVQKFKKVLRELTKTYENEQLGNIQG